MSASKPDCADFIVAAARKIRIDTGMLRPGTAAGVSPQRLYQVAKQAYSDAEFLEGVEKAIKAGTVLVVADVSADDRSMARVTAVERIHSSKKWGYDRWFLNAEDQAVDPDENATPYHEYRKVLLYVVEDGLPNRPSKLLARKKSNTSLASDIIKEMGRK